MAKVGPQPTYMQEWRMILFSFHFSRPSFFLQTWGTLSIFFWSRWRASTTCIFLAESSSPSGRTLAWWPTRTPCSFPTFSTRFTPLPWLGRSSSPWPSLWKGNSNPAAGRCRYIQLEGIDCVITEIRVPSDWVNGPQSTDQISLKKMPSSIVRNRVLLLQWMRRVVASRI